MLMKTFLLAIIPSALRLDTAVLRGSPPSALAEGFEGLGDCKIEKMCYSISKGNLKMSNELAPKDPNQLKIELAARSSGEFAKPDKTRQSNAIILEPTQEKAVELMLAGVSDTEIAKKIKVTRQTVNYWRNQDIDFIYELQMRRSQVRDSCRDELIDLYKVAIEEIKKGLKNKDPKIRLQVAMQIVRLPALQENLKNKTLADPKTIKAERFEADIRQALEETTTELGYKK